MIFRIIFFLMVSCFIPGCNITISQDGSKDHWQTSDPVEQGLNMANLIELDSVIQYHLPHVRCLLIVKNGYLVFEKYYHGSAKNELHNVQSITKSVTSALVGIALEKGQIKDIDAKVLDYFPEIKDSINDERMKDITIKNVLTMSSGIDEIPTMFGADLAYPNYSTLETTLLFDPGTEFKYSSPSTHLLSGILKKATGVSVLKYAEQNLFKPLGVEKMIWYKDKTGLQYGCGSSLWRARDILKFGQLYLNKGKWNGKQLVPESYIDESVQIHISGDFYGSWVDYGYLWWIDTIGGYFVYSAEGYGSQSLKVFPDLNMVVLVTTDWIQPVFPENKVIYEKCIVPAVIK